MNPLTPITRIKPLSVRGCRVKAPAERPLRNTNRPRLMSDDALLDAVATSAGAGFALLLRFRVMRRTEGMTLTIGPQPLGSTGPRTVNYRIDGPKHRLLFDPFPRRVRAYLGGELVLDTRRGMLLHESNMMVQLYVPEDDVRAKLTLTDHTTHCPFKG